MRNPLISRFQSTLSAVHSSSTRWTGQRCFLLLATAAWTIAARAQTAPVLPGADNDTAASGTVAKILLSDEQETDTEGIETSSPTDAVSIVRDGEVRQGAGALRWNYMLDGDNLPQISLEAGTALSAARSVRFWLKTAQPAAIAMWFETARETGVDTVPKRFMAHFWSRGGDWQAIELARDRFVPQTPVAQNAAKAADSTADPTEENSDWNRIARYGLMDVSNFWLKRAGQARIKGARSLSLDSVQVSTEPAANTPLADAVLPASQAETVPATPAPVAPRIERDNRQTSRSQPPGASSDATALNEGELEDAEETAEPAAAPVDPPIVIAQDALGDGRLWIPINGQTTDSDKGLEWSLVRLANRNLSLMTAVNPQLFARFPLQAIQLTPKPKPADLKALGKADRWARLVIDLSTQKATRINVAVVERGGATYSMTVPLDQRRKRHRQTLPLPRFQLERTSRDPNNQIDLDQIEYLSISDVGAQTGTSGPNLIRLNGLTWMY